MLADPNFGAQILKYTCQWVGRTEWGVVLLDDQQLISTLPEDIRRAPRQRRAGAGAAAADPEAAGPVPGPDHGAGPAAPGAAAPSTPGAKRRKLAGEQSVHSEQCEDGLPIYGLSVCLSVCLLSVIRFLSISVSLRLSLCGPSISLSVCLSVSQSACTSVSLPLRPSASLR